MWLSSSKFIYDITHINQPRKSAILFFIEKTIQIIYVENQRLYFSSYNFLFTENLEKRFVCMEHKGTLADNLTYVFTMRQGWTAKQGYLIYFYFSAARTPYCNNFSSGNNNRDHIKSSLNRISLIILNFLNLYFLIQIRIKMSYYI